MKSSRTSLLLMTLPVLGLLAFGFWQQRNPPEPAPDPNKFSITAQITKEPIYPVDVWAGRDTKLAIPYQPNGPWPAGWGVNSVEWLRCVRLLARKNGKERLLFSSGDDANYQSYMRWFPEHNGTGGDSVGRNGGRSELSFALRKVPLEWGEIWLYLDLGLRPAASIDSRDIDAATVARLKAQGGAVWVSKSLRLRSDGEEIKMPVVSTNPQLALQDWHIENVSLPQYGEDRHLILHVFYSGSLPHDGRTFSPVAASDWTIVDEKQQSRANYGGASALGHLVKGRRTYEVKFGFSSRLAPKARRLRLKGQLTCNNRWPLIIDIPLLDRTKKVTNGAAHHN